MRKLTVEYIVAAGNACSYGTLARARNAQILRVPYSLVLVFGDICARFSRVSAHTPTWKRVA